MYIGQSTGAASYSASNPINGSYAVEAEGLTLINGKLMSRALKHSWSDKGFRFGVVGFGAHYGPSAGSDGLVVGGNSTASLTLTDYNGTDVDALAWAGDKGQGRMWLGGQPNDDTVHNPVASPVMNARIAGAESRAIDTGSWGSDYNSVYSPASANGVSTIKWNVSNPLATVTQNGSTKDYTGFATEFTNKSANLATWATTGSVTYEDADDSTFTRSKYASAGSTVAYGFNTGSVWVKERKVVLTGDGTSKMQVFTIQASDLNNITKESLPYTTTGKPGGYTGVDFDFENIPMDASGNLNAAIVVNVVGGPVDFHNGWRFWVNGDEIGNDFEENDLYARAAQSILWNFTGGDVTIRGGFANASDKHTDDDPAAGMIGSILVSHGSFEDHVSTNGRVYVSGDYSMYNPTKAASFKQAGANDGDSASVIDMDQERHNFPWAGTGYVSCAALTWNKVAAHDTTKKLPGSQWGIYATEDAATNADPSAPDTTASTLIATVTDGGTTSDASSKVMADISSADGIITVVNLAPNATYHIRELKAPTGYKLNGTVYSVTLGGGGSITTLPGDGDGNIKDELLPGTVSWAKKDDTVSGGDLLGSVWNLSTCSDSTATTGQACSSWTPVKSDITSSTAEFTEDGIVDGALYRLTETAAPTGYETAGPFYFIGKTNAPAQFVDAAGAPLASGDTYTYESGVNYVADSRKPGAVTWQKVDAAGGALLPGSEWKLYYSSDSGTTWTSDDSSPTVSDADDTTSCTASATVLCDENPDAGSLKLSNLKWGIYRLVETKAPTVNGGYILDSTPHEFTIDADHLAPTIGSDGKIANNKAITSLPLTGSMWTPRNVAVLGLGLIGVAALSLGVARCRRRG